MIASLPKEAQQYIQAKQQDSNVAGMILFGSWAHGDNRPDSDVDLIILSESETRRGIENPNGVAIELVITTEEDARQFWSLNIDDCANIWSYAKVIFDKDGTIHRLKSFAEALISKCKPTINQERRSHLRFDSEDLVKAVTKISIKDPLAATLLLVGWVHNDCSGKS